MNNYKIYLFIVFFLTLFVQLLFISSRIFANSTSNFTQTINPGTLTVDIVDTTNSNQTVSNPTIAMNPINFSFSCQTSTGTFGSTTQAIYVQNPDAADGGWTVSLAASSPTAYWDSAGTDIDFNDANGSGCTDGADTDSLKGQMTVDPSGGTISKGNCSSCTTANITLGSSGSFVEGTTNSITIVSGAAASDDIGDWSIIGATISQKIPGEQPAGSDYNINMTLSVVAS